MPLLVKKSKALGSTTGGVGIVFAPGPDNGLYVKSVAVGGPTWHANQRFSGQKDGREGIVRVGDCLLDIQEIESDRGKPSGKKRDVFGMPLQKIKQYLFGPPGSYVELTFRRTTDLGDPYPISVLIQRGKKASHQDVEYSRAHRLDIEAQRRFEEIDEDGSGELSLEEVVQYLQHNPLPGQTHVWETATLLFRKADKDGSGSIDVNEFEAAFDDLYQEYSRHMLEASKQHGILERFQQSLLDVRESLLETVKELPRYYFLKLAAIVHDPEENFLIYSIYELRGWDPSKPASGTFYLRTGLRATDPERFWDIFARVNKILKTAQQKIARTGYDDQVEEDEQEQAIEKINHLVHEPQILSEEEVQRQRSRLPLIRNMTGRNPGRGIPVRQWIPYNEDSFVSRQRVFQMPTPFLGRTDTVYHLLNQLSEHRLITVVGEVGSGKSTVVQALLFTLQQRARESANGLYMYKDGVFMVHCGNFTIFERLYYALGAVMKLLVTQLPEFIVHVKECNFLLVLDGVEHLLRSDAPRLRDTIFQLLDGVPGLSLMLTCPAPVAVPYECIVAINKLSHMELANLVQMDGIVNQFYSGNPICDYFNGNPLCARIATAIFKDLSIQEAFDIITTVKEKDLAALGISKSDRDPWLDGVKLHFAKDGSKYGASLAMRAWLKIGIGWIKTNHLSAYFTLRVLHFFPAGLQWQELSACVVDPATVMRVLAEEFKLVVVVDGHGDIVADSSQMVTSRTGLYMLRGSVRTVMEELHDEMPPESARMLKQLLPRIDKQAETIYMEMTQRNIVQGMGHLEVVEANLWACIDFDRIMQDDVLRFSPEGFEWSGKIGLFVAMIMVSLNRLPEAMSACWLSCRFFVAYIQHELSKEAIAHRSVNTSIKVKGLMSLGQAMRLSGEIKLQMGANEGAKVDLERAFALLCPIKHPSVRIMYNGSRLGQADVLWSMAECECTKGSFQSALTSVKQATNLYKEADNPVGLAMSRALEAQLLMIAGNMVGAYDALNKAAAVLQENGMLPRLAEALCIRAELALSASNIPRAREDAAEAKKIFMDRNDLSGWAYAWKLEGECLSALDQKDEAVWSLEQGRSVAAVVNHTYIRAECERVLGEVKTSRVIKGERTPRYDEAVGHLKRALDAYQQVGSRLGYANTHRALAALYQVTEHPKHYRQSLEEALEHYEAINHRLGVAVTKADLAQVKLQKKQSEDARQLIGESLPVLQDVNRRYKVADRTGMMVTEGKDMRRVEEDNSLRVEDDVFWKQHLAKVNFGPTGHMTAGDVVREVMGSYALGLERQNPESNILSVRVGLTGDQYLDGVHCWEEGRGWQFADDAEHRAFDEVHWLNMDAKGRKMAAAATRKSHRHEEQLLSRLGIRPDSTDEDIKELAARSFLFLDEDGSGKLTIKELGQSFDSLGLHMEEAELRDMVAEIDDDGDGMVDMEEFKNMVLQTVQRIQEKVRIGGEGGIAVHEDAYRGKLEERKAEIHAQMGTGLEDGAGHGHGAVEEVAIIAAAKHQISFQEHHTTGDKEGGMDLRRNSFKEAAGVGMTNERKLKDLPMLSRKTDDAAAGEAYHTHQRRVERPADHSERDRLEALREEAVKRKLHTWADIPNPNRRTSDALSHSHSDLSGGEAEISTHTAR